MAFQGGIGGMSFHDWSEQIVGELLELKPTGMTFEEAWAQVVKAHPPRGFWPREDARDQVSWLRRVCEDAWDGKRPALAAFTMDLVAS
jgi:hypothetical protein